MAKDIREKVVAFRLTTEQFAALEKKFAASPPVGVKSASLMCRKMALDYTFDELTWRSKRKAGLAPDMYLPEARAHNRETKARSTVPA